ncbi:plasmid partitioning protein RepB [Rhizobium sp. L1K21]|uniref:plasmid partitioning protein RepB n=1 Tax=Rhizobium sp. L1K21 TaxID=2954933 RepID=UPI002093FA06|nr:plasmid partitioning protein RepB [Rhizobium sp. L1K21]MCO6187626.1 plasmid partitioning protein RepB [Rhizobium sp. L1K21]
MSRKDSKGLFANVLNQLNEPVNQAAPEKKSAGASPHLAKVAAGVKEIQQRGELADRLLKDGAHVVELDPSLISPSAIPDRFEGAYDEAAIAELKESMAERGQIVPGLVRPLQGEPGRYQIVYGRRRLAAVKLLGQKFKTVIRDLSDEEAVIFQGEENTARNDLSFIEKCSFAYSQEQAGFSRATISASLSTGKSHISEMIRVASVLPEKLRRGIGPAPEIGRRRWLELVERWNKFPAAHPHSLEMVEALGPNISSEERFAAVLSSLFEKNVLLKPKGEEALPILSKGMKLADVRYSKSGAKLNFSKSVPDDFVRYLVEQIEEIHDAYLKDTANDARRSG